MGKTKDVRAAVEKELGFDPKVDSADVSVRNINGDVIPIGTVPRYPRKRGGPHAAEGCERCPAGSLPPRRPGNLRIG